MIKKISSILVIILIITLLTACSSTIKSRVLKSIKESSIDSSYIAYNERDERWYNFKDQNEEIQEKYLIWLDEIADYVSGLELKEISADEFRGSTGLIIKVIDGDHKYIFHQKQIWPDTNFLKFSIDDKDKYYKLMDGDGEELVNLMLVYENAPFNVIGFYEYLDNEAK